jgi:hypothetical protein
MSNHPIPILTKKDLLLAIRAMGPNAHYENIQEARRRIIERAKEIDVAYIIPGNWNEDGTLNDSQGDNLQDRHGNTCHCHTRGGCMVLHISISGGKVTTQINDCPACYPRPVGPVCEDCNRVLARGIHMFLFHFMEAGFGAAMGLAAVNHAWVAVAVFAFAAFMSAFLVIREDRQ